MLLSVGKQKEFSEKKKTFFPVSGKKKKERTCVEQKKNN